MESNRRLILLLIVFLTTSHSPATSSLVTVAGEKVSLTLYYEALCPYCENFIVNHLYKIFHKGLISIVDLKLSPYGNAKISSNGTVICQHGEWECVLNTVEACAIHAWPVVSDYFPFVYCVEKLTSEEKYAEWETCFEKLNLDPKPVTDCISSGFGHEYMRVYALLRACLGWLIYKYAEWETCFEKLNLDPKPVTDCISSGFGHELNLQYADEIKVLEPPHTYVPWVVLNGQPLYDDYEDFISLICNAYKGSNVPLACLGLSRPISTTKDNAKPLNHVCYKEDNAKSESKSTLSKFLSSTTATWMHQIGIVESM